MRFCGANFSPVSNSSGARGFYGENYWYHPLWKLAGLSYKNCEFQAKTTTMHGRLGNMPLKEDGITPRELKPACIIVKFLKGVTLNAVGLSGPGAAKLLASGRWQKRRKPFFISFMSVEKSAQDRLSELKEFVNLLLRYIPGFKASFGLEKNDSCPNVGLDTSLLLNEAGEAFDIMARLRIALRYKVTATTPPQLVSEITKHPACDAITAPNTISWGKLPKRIDWKGLFGSDISPLAHLGGGGFSGWPVASIACDWIRETRDFGCKKPIIANGIHSWKDVKKVKQAGANGIQIGTVGMLRPWRTQHIINYAHELFK